jgi:hypothetical protein
MAEDAWIEGDKDNRYDEGNKTTLLHGNPLDLVKDQEMPVTRVSPKPDVI